MTFKKVFFLVFRFAYRLERWTTYERIYLTSQRPSVKRAVKVLASKTYCIHHYYIIITRVTQCHLHQRFSESYGHSSSANSLITALITAFPQCHFTVIANSYESKVTLQRKAFDRYWTTTCGGYSRS